MLHTLELDVGDTMHGSSYTLLGSAACSDSSDVVEGFDNGGSCMILPGGFGSE